MNIESLSSFLSLEQLVWNDFGSQKKKAWGITKSITEVIQWQNLQPYPRFTQL